jgi:hypothetical protein
VGFALRGLGILFVEFWVLFLLGISDFNHFYFGFRFIAFYYAFDLAH